MNTFRGKMDLWKALDIARKQCRHLHIILKRSDYVYMEF